MECPLTLPQRRLLALVVAGLVGAVAVIPHLLMNLAQLLGSGILITLAAAAGTWFAPRAGLTAPIIDAALTRQPFGARARSVASLAIALAVAAALAVIAADVVVFGPLLQRAQTTPPTAPPPLWTGVLAALYGGLTEEILLRYGVMSLLAWLLAKMVQGPALYWAAIAGSAVLLGLAHLPATAALLPLTPLVVTRTIVLNGLVGMVFGWIYWRRGLEAAMVSHGAAALVLHPAVVAIGV